MERQMLNNKDMTTGCLDQSVFSILFGIQVLWSVIDTKNKQTKRLLIVFEL